MSKGGKALRRRLEIVWAADLAQPVRYVPRAFVGGPSWGVFDRQAQRFLSNAEVSRIPVEVIRSARTAVQ